MHLGADNRFQVSIFPLRNFSGTVCVAFYFVLRVKATLYQFFSSSDLKATFSAFKSDFNRTGNTIAPHPHSKQDKNLTNYK